MTGRRGIRRQKDSTGTSFGRFGQNTVVSDDQYRKDRGHRGPSGRVFKRPSPGVLPAWVNVHAILFTVLSGSECALIGLLENILAPLWVFARFGDVPSAWTVAGGALLLATLIGHEVAAREPVRVSQPGARGYRTVNNL